MPSLPSLMAGDPHHVRQLPGAMECVHHKRRATTSGSLATPPFGSLFPSPRGVGKAFRWAAIACASPPAEETGKAIVWVQFS